MGRSVRVQAFVLRTVDFGERDRVVSLLSRERGKLSAFARGARSSRRRFGGALEPFTRLAAELRERPGAELWTLDDVFVERGHGAIRGDLARIACAGYACELARELVRDAEPHPELFDLLAGYLEALDGAPARPGDLRAFEMGALRVAGLQPRLDACARCGERLEEGDPSVRLRFDPGQGGLLCRACGDSASAACPPIRLGTALALSRLPGGGELPPGGLAEARQVLCTFIEHHLGHRLASRRFLDEMGHALKG